MNSISEITQQYFRTSKDSFWHWAENGTVIEWKDGNTICYREDLLLVLRKLAPYGIPPLGSILLVMAACQDRWKNADGKVLLRKVFHEVGGGKRSSSSAFFDQYLESAIEFMDLINELPKTMRRGNYRVHLFQELFKNEGGSFLPNPTGVVDEFLSGRLDNVIFSSKKVEDKYIVAQKFRRALISLTKVSRRFPTAEILELALRTGLTELPEPIELEELEEDENEEKSLLDQLRDDPKTEGIAKLSQRIIAGLNIPMHSLGASDQSFGGVSDITNRGDIDKLLLSELAYDDTTLMVRLANNEAMYLRREELPSNLQKQRIILLDGTIKMWGMPRTFAMSVGLACAIQDKNVAEVSAYLLSGEKSHEVNLSTKEGVIKGMEELYPELHCAEALHLFVEENQLDEQTELILVTDEVNLQNRDFKMTLNEVRSALTYLITIDRGGQLHFYEYSLSGRRLVSKTLYDLEELLFGKEKKKTFKISLDLVNGLPEIYAHHPLPLLFPSPSIRFSSKNTFDLGEGGIVAVTNDQRILQWKQRGYGAIELLQNIELGEYHLTFSEGQYFILVVAIEFFENRNQKVLKKWYIVDPENQGEHRMVDFSLEKIKAGKITCQAGTIYIMTPSGTIYFINAESDGLKKYDQFKIFTLRNKPNFSQVKKTINNGYTTLRKGKRITLIGSTGMLKINDWEICFMENKVLLQKSKNWGTEFYFEDVPNLTRGQTRFRKTTLGNGNQVIADSNGLLHLISLDENLPQITIPMIVGKYTAAWASDGVVTGSSYFIGASNPNRISPKEFKEKYILPFLMLV